MRIAVPDLISPSYFPAIAAVDLGLARDEGLDVELELLYPVTDAAEALRTGEIDFLAGAAHAPMHAFPHWRGAKLVVALSRNMYWFLVMRADLGIARGDLGALKGCGSAPLPAPTSACGACSPPRASTPNATASASAPSRPPTAPAPRSASPRHRRCGTGWSTGSGPTAWAPRSPSARAAARSSSTPGAATAPGRGRLHVPRARGHRRHDRPPPRRRRRDGPRRRPRAGGAPRRPRPRRRGRRAPVPARGGVPDRRPRAPGRPLLRPRMGPETIDALTRFGRESGLLDGPVAHDAVVATRFRDLWTPPERR